MRALHVLDHKIPPPVVALVCAGLAWLLARATPDAALDWPLRAWATGGLVAMGLLLDAWGLLAFRRAGTTLNPLAPGRSTAVVLGGPYRITRNPMYLGMACVLLGVCVWLANPFAPLAVLAFVAYITRFQILPEERVLLAKFGAPYEEYLRTVRRWL